MGMIAVWLPRPGTLSANARERPHPVPPVPSTAPGPQPSGVALRVHEVHWPESLPGAGWRRAGRLATVAEQTRRRPWRLPPSGGLRVRPERPGGAVIVFARRSGCRRALCSWSCVPSVELTVVYRCCSRLCRLLQLMNPNSCLLPQVRAALDSSAERVGFAQDDWSSPARSSAAMPTHD